MTPEISQKVMQMLGAIQNSIAPAVKETLTLALQVTQVNALGNILLGVPSLLILIASCFLIKSILDKRRQYYAEKKGRDFYMSEEWPVPVIIVTIFIDAGAFASLIFYWFDIYNWVGVFNPKLYLAHQIMQRFIGG